MTVISVIVGSTREGRFSEKPAQWILQHLKKRDGVEAPRALVLSMSDAQHLRCTRDGIADQSWR
jgi:NAD(P)H-dependent FMN reductase